jgi:hypothetical protein
MSSGLFQIRPFPEAYEIAQQVKVILLRLKCNTVRYLTTIGRTNNIPSEGISNFENGLLNAMQRVIIKFDEISVIS